MWKTFFKPPFLRPREIIVITISLLIFVVSLLFSSQFIKFWSNFSIKREGVRVEAIIQKELNNISKQREQIIASGVFTDALERNNQLDVLTIAQNEAKVKGVDVIITDREGFVFARSHLPGQKGDNTFETTIQGKNVSKGQTVTAIVRGARSPLALISDSLIFDKDKNSLGSVVVGRGVNDSYATYFQKEYLKKGEQIVFYTSQEGIVGDSFNDKEKTKLINTYFSLGSDIATQNLAGLSKEIKIGGKYYIIRNITFPGIEESPGGTFVFYPVNHSLYSILLAGGITILFFFLYYLTLFLLKFLYRYKHRTLIVIVLGFILFIVMYLVSMIKLDSSALEIKKLPYLIYNSTLKFEPESDVINQSSEKTIAIKISTGGESINAVSAVVNYDPKAIEVLDILTTNSFCDPSFFLEKEINKKKGEIRITCVIPNPGYAIPTGVVAELLVQPLGLNPISLLFTKETKVLANDGLGTNVLRMVTNGYYQVVQEVSSITNIKDSISIFSLSHPNSNRWYKNKNIKLSWPLFQGGTYYYTLNHSIDIDSKDKMYSTVNNYLNTSVNEDGIYYFHLYVKDITGESGPVSNFKIMIDATPPSAPSIQVSSESIKKSDILRLNFTSLDALSGLQSGFYININNGIFLPVNPPFYIPFLQSGDYPIVVRVFDKANNFSDSKTVIHVSN